MKVLVQDRRPPSPPPRDAAYDNQQLFADTSFWRTPIPASPPLHANSEVWRQNICYQFKVDANATGLFGEPVANSLTAPWFGLGGGNYRVVVVPADQPMVGVGCRLVMAGHTPGGGWARPLHDRVIQGVPVPPDIQANRITSDVERGVTIWCPGLDRLWEFIGLRPLGDPVVVAEGDSLGWDYEGPTPGVFEGHPFAWTYSSGGVMDNVSTNNGVFKDIVTGSVQTQYRMWGGAATSIPYCAGLITPDEARAVLRGDADDFGHTLKASVANAAPGFISPAQRGDGTAPATWIQEGARWYLPITDFSPYTGELLLTQGLIKTVARYGMVAADRTGRGMDAPNWRDPSGYNVSPFGPEFYPSFFGIPFQWHPPDHLQRIPWHKARVVATSVSPA